MSRTLRVKVIKPIHIGPTSEVWIGRVSNKKVIARRFIEASLWPPPPDPHVLLACNHRAICRFIGIAQDDDGGIWYIFNHFDGVTLADLVRIKGPSPELAERCLLQLAPALRFIHARSPVSPRIHGDISARNVFICNNGRLKLLDLLAIPPGTYPVSKEVIFGTLPYLAPEVLCGRAPDERSDVYGLGVVALYAASGPLPWAQARSPKETCDALMAYPLTDIVMRASLSKKIGEVIVRMMAREPGLRPSANEVCITLRDLYKSGPA